MVSMPHAGARWSTAATSAVAAGATTNNTSPASTRVRRAVMGLASENATAGRARLPTMTGCTNSTATCSACCGQRGAQHQSVALDANRRARAIDAEARSSGKRSTSRPASSGCTDWSASSSCTDASLAPPGDGSAARFVLFRWPTLRPFAGVDSADRPVYPVDPFVLPVGGEGFPQQSVDIPALRLGAHGIVFEAEVPQAFTGGNVAIDREVHLRSSPEGVLADDDGDRLGPETLGIVVDGGVEGIDGESDVQAAHRSRAACLEPAQPRNGGSLWIRVMGPACALPGPLAK